MAQEDGGDLVVAATTDRSMISVDYPGYVNNVKSALDRLGGISALTKAHIDGGKLEMKFRPRDSHCKPFVSKHVTEPIIIFKIKRKKKSSGDWNSDYVVDMIGVISKSFQFNGITDFQVLPPGLSTNKFADLNDFQMKDPLEKNYCSRKLPSFLLPSYFSKHDKPSSYMYRSAANLVIEESASSTDAS